MMRPCQVGEEEQGKEGAIAEGQVVVVEDFRIKICAGGPQAPKELIGLAHCQALPKF
jgi:hypothetical protein